MTIPLSTAHPTIYNYGGVSSNVPNNFSNEILSLPTNWTRIAQIELKPSIAVVDCKRRDQSKIENGYRFHGLLWTGGMGKKRGTTRLEDVVGVYEGRFDVVGAEKKKKKKAGDCKKLPDLVERTGRRERHRVSNL